MVNQSRHLENYNRSRGSTADLYIEEDLHPQGFESFTEGDFVITVTDLPCDECRSKFLDSNMYSPNPTKAQWEDQKALIIDLYMVQNLTADAVVAYLERTQGWKITPRQLKSRFQEWAVSGQKRTRSPYYLAMLAVSIYRQGKERQETIFRIPKRYTTEEVDKQKIVKEVNRVKDGYDNIPTYTAAKKLLLEAGYSWYTPHGNINSRVRQCVSGMDSNTHDRDGFAFDFAMSPSIEDETIATSICSVPESKSLIHDDFDFANVLMQTFTHVPTDHGGKGGVGQWAGPYCQQAFNQQLNTCELNFQKTAAMEHFRSMLRHNFDNQYIFPCLSWVVSVLGSRQKDAELDEFLHSSCSVVIEEKPDSLMHTTPFLYTLAVQTKNQADKLKYGNSLPKCHDQVSLVWGPAHPNTLVIKSLYAWHLVEMTQYSGAIEILLSSLPTFERVMGPHDQLSISCRAILARAYRELGRHEEAISHLRKAVGMFEHMGEPIKPLAFRFHLRLGELLADMGDFTLAEKHLMNAVVGRISVFGLQAEKTWSAIRQLCRFLEDTGRSNDVEAFLNKLELKPGCSHQQLADLRLRLRYRRHHGGWHGENSPQDAGWPLEAFNNHYQV